MNEQQPKLSHLCLALCFGVLGALAVPAVAVAQDPAAKPAPASGFDALVEEGGKKYQAKDYVGAAEAFKKAYDLKPTPNLLYNIGRIYEKAGKFDEAVSYYKRFVKQPDVSHVNRKDALERVKNLEEVLALDKKKDPPKKDPPKKDPPKKDPPKKDPPKKVEPPPAPNYTPAYAAFGVGAVGLVGSGIFGLLAQNQHSNFESASSLQARQDAASAGKTNAIIADSLLVVGVIGAVTGTILYITASPEKPAQPATTGLTPQVSPTSVGVGWSARF